MLQAVTTWLTETILALGYPGIVVLMAIESSFFPFPSEVVLPPAGFLAAQGRMDPVLATVSGVGGSLIGALLNYYLAMALGRPFLRRYGRYVLVKERSLDRAEAFFRRHGEISTFVGRLIPVIRQLISVPAGVARMRLGLFALYTALGAGIWCSILTYIGWYVGRHSSVIGDLDELIGSDAVREYVTRITLVLLPVLALLVIFYASWYRRRTAKKIIRGESEGMPE